MNLKQIRDDLAQGEGLHREFKEASSQLPRNHFGEITPENLRPFSKNPTICKFMIQLGRFDELGSGVTNINKYLPRYAKGAKPVFKETLHGFELTIPLAAQHEAQQVTTKNPARTQQVTQQVAELLIALTAVMSRAELMVALGLRDRVNFSRVYVEPALSDGLVELTQPNAPKSPSQKYRLTTKGKQMRKWHK